MNNTSVNWYMARNSHNLGRERTHHTRPLLVQSLKKTPIHVSDRVELHKGAMLQGVAKWLQTYIPVST